MEKNYIPDVDFTSKNFEEFLSSMKIACAVLKKEWGTVLVEIIFKRSTRNIKLLLKI